MQSLVILFSLLFITIQCKTLERDVVALRLFKKEVINRDRYWKGIMKSWSGGGANGEDDPCADGWRSSWEGVECRFQGDLDADVPRVVTNIHVTDSNVTGPVPMAISLLSDLVEIDMDGNKISGPLNPYVGCLSKLKELDMANNSLTGSIPTEWRLLSKLEEAELEFNSQLRGCVPLGMPPVETVCPENPRPNQQKCFLIGTIVTDTAVDGFCSDAPPLEKRCPDVPFVKQFIEDGTPYELYFQSQAPSRTELEAEIREEARDNALPSSTARETSDRTEAPSPTSVREGRQTSRSSSLFDLFFG